MFMNADMPVTRVVDLGVQIDTMGSPSDGYPAGFPWAPANAVARKTDVKVKKAEAKPSLDSMLNVRGNEPSQLTAVMATAKATVRHA